MAGALAWFGKAAYERSKAAKKDPPTPAAGDVVGTVRELKRQVEGQEKLLRDLHEWHDKTNEDGIRVWYVSREHNRSLREISKAMTQQSKVMVQQTELMRRLVDDREDAVAERIEARKDRQTILAGLNRK